MTDSPCAQTASSRRSKAGRKSDHPITTDLNHLADTVGVPTHELIQPVALRADADATVTRAMISNTVRGRGSIAIAAAITWILQCNARQLWPDMNQDRISEIDRLRTQRFG